MNQAECQFMQATKAASAAIQLHLSWCIFTDACCVLCWVIMLLSIYVLIDRRGINFFFP